MPNSKQAKVTRWAKSDGEGQIAFEIRDYVKQVLLTLPIPIPEFFVNSVANVVIPVLAKYIVVRAVGPISLCSPSTQD